MIAHRYAYERQQHLLEQNLELSIANLLRYTQEPFIECNANYAIILPPKNASLSKRVRDKGLQMIHAPLKEKPANIGKQKKQAKRALQLMCVIISRYCQCILQEKNIDKQNYMHKNTHQLKATLKHFKFNYTQIDPQLSTLFSEAAHNIYYVDASLNMIHHNIHALDENILRLTSLNITQITTSRQLKKAIKIIQGGFIELYRETEAFYPIDMIKELLFSKYQHAKNHQQLNEFGKYLSKFIHTNLSLFNRRPKMLHRDNPLRDRDAVLKSHANMLNLEKEKQGGSVRDSYVFLHHKLQSFLGLFKNDMDKGTIKIFNAFIHNFSIKQYRSIYKDHPFRYFNFKQIHFENQQYFPTIRLKVQNELENFAENFLETSLRSKYASIGIYFPSGYTGHCAPFLIKPNSDKKLFHILWANAGSGSVGQYTLIPSVEHYFGNISKGILSDLNSHEVKIGEVVTEYGPFTKKETVSIIARACLLRKLIYVPYDFIDQNDHLTDQMKEGALIALLDPNKKIKHTLLNQLDFQVIGNCFLKNPDLLVKDQLANHVKSLLSLRKNQKAKKAQRILNIYHEEFMVKKQIDGLTKIPKKRSISIQ